MMTQNSNRLAKSRHDYQPLAFSIPTINLTFELDETATRVSACMTVKRLQSGQPLILDGQQLELVSIAVNGALLTAEQYSQNEQQLIVNDLPDDSEIVIVTQINPAENSALEGLYLAGSTFCTQCEAEGFRRITYFPDRPDVLSEYRVTIKADAARYPFLLSNGNKVAEQVDGNGQRIVSWHDPFPKPSYLFALVAGDFDLLQDSFVTQSGREVSLQLFVEKGQAFKGEFALTSLKRAMRWDEQRFNLEYDLDIYMVVAVDFFNMGAMENKGLNIFNSKFVLADERSATDRDYFNIESIIGHEYFHNWTGNRVTCRDWFQLSLKEGLTVFRDQEFSADMGSPTLCRIDAVKTIRTAQFAEDASPMAHPIRPESVLEMNNFYTVTVYDKGAEVIRMLQTILGRDAFNRGLALYLTRHDGQAATCDDFVQAMQDASGRDLSQFSRWYSQSGTPQLSVRQSYDASAATLTLTLAQHTAATADQTDKQPLLIPVATEFLFADGSAQQHLLLLTQPEQQFAFNQLSEQPVVAWLTHFSAPVKLLHNTDDNSLLLIADKASDGVARWDAMQQFWSNKVRQVVAGEDVASVLPAQLFDMMRTWLSRAEGDKALLAELLTLPDFDSLAEQYDVIPVDAILHALAQFKAELAKQLQSVLLQCYQQLSFSAYQYEQQQVAQRKLRAVCLGYLALCPELAPGLLASQLSQADNMTDTLAVLTASQQHLPELFRTQLQQFIQQWQHDVLVLDKAFSLAATEPSSQVYANIQTCLEHPAFSWKNPNRVRAVFSAFSMRNPQQFHAISGKGYALLADTVARLDSINPQVAARLVTPLLSWKRFDGVRQQQMQAALQQMAAKPALSNDLFEKVNRSLN